MKFKALAKAAIHILQTPKASQKPFAARVCLPLSKEKHSRQHTMYSMPKLIVIQERISTNLA